MSRSASTRSRARRSAVRPNRGFFPVNMTFPFVVGFFVATHIAINWGSILHIAMGHWYIFFNVIAGAMAIPNPQGGGSDSRSARLADMEHVNLPAIFPFWCDWGPRRSEERGTPVLSRKLPFGVDYPEGRGLGAFISEVTEKGETPLIICSIAVMALRRNTNKLVWRRLYGLAEKRSISMNHRTTALQTLDTVKSADRSQS